MFEDEAESGDDDEDGDEEAEVGFEEERCNYFITQNGFNNCIRGQMQLRD